MKYFDVLVSTAESEVFRGRATKVVANTKGGELGFLPGHAPLLASLRPGVLRIDRRTKQRDLALKCFEVVVHGGFIEVQPDRVIILADIVERAADLDLAKVEKAVRSAKSGLALANNTQLDIAMMTLQLELARYHVACRGSGIEPRLRF